MTVRLICFASIALAWLASSADAAAPSLRRYALVIGSNRGSSDRELLRYADHDAATMADVLQQLGGVDHTDLELLREPDARDLDRAFDTLAKRVADERKHGQRVELVIYYSGHADESGILLGGARYDYARLRQRIRAVPADVHIAILDSCASGNFTRMKGGVRVPAFLHDSSNQVHGFAFLSSSSADEDAQESDRIGASFFTYYFVAALRGAADRNHDGKITLGEAYQFSYEQTLGRTQNTVHGAQHPAYDMHLSGTGDVVITDLRGVESALVLPPGLRGRVTIVDKDGRVAVELVKPAGEALRLALPRGSYTVRVDGGPHELVATVTLDRDAVVAFDIGTLREATPEDTIARGAARDDDDDFGPPRRHRHIPVDFGGGLRVELPATKQSFDGLVTLGGTSREVHGRPVVGVAESGELSLGATLGGRVGFAYDLSLAVGPGVFIGDHLQVGATIGGGFSGISNGILEFAWKIPTEGFVLLELSRELRAMAYLRQSYVFDANTRKHGSAMALWGDEAELGAGVRFYGRLDGFSYGSVREMARVRYWGVGVGAIF
jgi:hypothetical protein